MLYDPEWEVKADPLLTLESLIAWLEKQPAATRYNYGNCDGRCLYGQYMAAHGVRWMDSGAAESNTARGDFCSWVYSHVACQRPWTFGAALKRARAALSSQR